MDATQAALNKSATATDGVPAATAVPSTELDQPPTLPGVPSSSSATGDKEARLPAGTPSEAKAEPPPTPSKTATLQMQIQALASLQTRLAKIRSLPLHLLIFHSQSPLISFGGLHGIGLGGGNGPSDSDTIDSILNPDAEGGATLQAREMGLQAQVAFRMLNDTREVLGKEMTQGALKSARESETQDKLDISLYSRRARKKRRIAAADSPAPFPSFHLESTRIFPPLQPKDKKMERLDDLVLYIREFNRSKSSPGGSGSRTRLGIWAPSRPKSGASRRVSDPLIVQVVIRDVTTIYVKLRHCNRNQMGNCLSVESVIALGPREKKGPYGHSDFTVYQKLTQQVARMVEKEPHVSFPQIMDLLTSYDELFITHCSVCQRVLPFEGHVPPVARVWKAIASNADGEKGQWEARHISCLHA